MKNAFTIFLTIVLASQILFAQTEDVLKYSMKTRWSEKVSANNVWKEYPRPQMTRESYVNLNGAWQYAIRSVDKGQPKKFQGKIIVPFVAESQLSGVKKLVGEKNYLWYKHTFKAPAFSQGERVLLHFGAVDWEAKVFLNGKEAGAHQGGFDAFSFDITALLVQGEQELVVRVWDPSDKGTQPRGKQVSEPQGIWYTPVTGIWQTVWLEVVPQYYISSLKATPDIDSRTVRIDANVIAGQNMKLRVTASGKGQAVSENSVDVNVQNESSVSLQISNPRLWSPADPFLYDLKVELLTADGKVEDRVGSYFGMRKVSLGKDAKGYTRILLNNKPFFQCGLLDQGWWPDGLYTPPSEEAMLYDIEATKQMGFNMLRKHVKVECARYYYNCDKMGMIVWQDMPNGNYLKELRIEAWETEDVNRPEVSAKQFELELKRMIDQTAHFPSILVWVPFNEGWGQYDTKRVTEWLKKYEPSRLVDSPSGWADRGVGDIHDVHIYPGPGMEAPEDNRAAVVGEFGGLGYPVQNHLWWDKRNWGYLTYGDKEKFTTEFEKIFSGLRGLVANGLSAAIYTQTTDVEGEVNGLITYDRSVTKIAPEKIREMVTSLYEEYWNAYYYVREGEYNAATWKVSSQAPSANWTAVDFDDFKWTSLNTPFSTFDNFFLKSATRWNDRALYLRKEFDAATVPNNLYLTHYMPGSKVQVYLNGELLWENEDNGGRKRHHTHVDISSQKQLMRKGKNVLSVALTKGAEKASFDLGLYTTDVMRESVSGNQ